MPAPVAVAPAAPVAPVTPRPVVTPTKTGAPATAPAAAAEPTFEVTVDGKPAQLTRKQIEKYAGKGAYADKVIQQAKEALAAVRKAEAEHAEREGIWDDEERLEAELRKRGKLDALARKRLQQGIAEAEMTPDQRALAERDAKIKALEDAQKKTEEERSQQRLNENAKRIQVHMESELAAAAERVGLTRDEEGFYAVYESMKEFRDLGLLDPKTFSSADAERICEAAKERIDGGFKRLESAVLKGLKGKALYDRLGRSVVDELNRYQIELVRGGGKVAEAPRAPQQVAPAPSEFLTIDQAREQIRKLRSK